VGLLGAEPLTLQVSRRRHAKRDGNQGAATLLGAPVDYGVGRLYQQVIDEKVHSSWRLRRRK
jgi:hypothetical protein